MMSLKILTNLLFVALTWPNLCDCARVGRMDKPRAGAVSAEDQEQMGAARQMLVALSAQSGSHRMSENAVGLSLATVSNDVDAAGTTVLRANQLYRGLRVLEGHVVLHVHREHSLAVLSKADRAPTGETKQVANCTQFFGQLVNGVDEDIEQSKFEKLQPNPEVELFKLKISSSRGPFSEEKAETVIYLNDENVARVGYLVAVRYFDGRVDKYPNRLVDLETGLVVRAWDGVQYIGAAALFHQRRAKRLTVTQTRVLPVGKGGGGNVKMGSWFYGVGKQGFTVTIYPNGTCAMLTPYARVVDYYASYPNQNTFTFNCSAGNNNDTANGAKSPLNDASFIVNQASQMYMSWYGEAALTEGGKGRGAKPMQVVVLAHYGGGGADVVYNGSGAATYGSGMMNIPDGNKFIWYPNTVGDVLSHELAHGVTEQTSVLGTSSQTSEADGLNEAFSDMAGKAYERFMYGKAGVDWGVAGRMMKGDLPLRYMDDPTRKAAQDQFYQGKTSIANAKDFPATGLNNHLSSGVFNKAFYCMSTKFQNDVWDAFDMFYVVNTRYWCPQTNFTAAAELMLAATNDIQAGKWAQVPWGYSWIKTTDIVECYKQVGITCKDTSSGTKLDTSGVQNCNDTNKWSCTVTG